MRKLAYIVLSALFSVAAASAGHAGTLDDVKASGEVKCGINTGLPGFAYTDDNGNWTGFDVAYCRAVSAAVFGDPDKVKYVNLTGKNRFPALRHSRRVRSTYSRATRLGRFRAMSTSASPSSV